MLHDYHYESGITKVYKLIMKKITMCKFSCTGDHCYFKGEITVIKVEYLCSHMHVAIYLYQYFIGKSLHNS